MTLRWLHIRHLIDEQGSTPKRKPLLSFAGSLVLLAALSCQLAFLTDINTCPQPFHEFLPLQGQCYSLHYEFLTWSEAQKFCNVNTGRLIEIYSETELNYLKKNFMNLPKNDVPSRIWLGAVSNGKKNIFKWDSTKDELTYDPAWAKGFPKLNSKVDSCASWLIQINYAWVNHDCEERMQFMCKMSVRGYKEGTHEKSNSDSKKPETVDPNAHVRILGQEIFQSSIMDKREIHANHHLTWYDALSLCESFNMTLLENHGIELTQPTMREENIWLGAIRHSYAKSQYEFQWLNGRKENLTGKVFHVEEETRVDKCLYANLKWNPIGLPLLHMTDCNETAFFKRTVCVKVRERYNCRDDSDCHRSASCIHEKCLCNVGYEGNGHLCFDVNECKKRGIEMLDICVSRQVGPCSNLIGSFTCRGCNPFHHEETSKCPYDPCDLIDCHAKEGKVLERIANKCRCRCMEGFINYGGYCFQIIHAEGHSALVLLRLAREWDIFSPLCRLARGNSLDLNERNQMKSSYRTFTLCKVWLRNEKRNSKCTWANFNDVIGCGSIRQAMTICKQQFDGIYQCNVDSDCSTVATCNKTANYKDEMEERDKTGICACKGGFYGDGHTCNECATITYNCPKDECDCFGPNWPMMRPCH